MYRIMLYTYKNKRLTIGSITILTTDIFILQKLLGLKRTPTLHMLTYIDLSGYKRGIDNVFGNKIVTLPVLSVMMECSNEQKKFKP